MAEIEEFRHMVDNASIEELRQMCWGLRGEAETYHRRSVHLAAELKAKEGNG